MKTRKRRRKQSMKRNTASARRFFKVSQVRQNHFFLCKFGLKFLKDGVMLPYWVISTFKFLNINLGLKNCQNVKRQ